MSNPETALDDACRRAAREGRRVVAVFGASWCTDSRFFCAMLDHPLVQPLIAAGYVVVRVDVGFWNHNLDTADRLGVPVARGIPAVAILDPDGTVVHAQTDGEFRNARSLPPAEIALFFNQWIPAEALKDAAARA